MKINISTPDGNVLNIDTGEKVKVPTTNGVIVILPGHASLLASLGIGEIIVSSGTESYIYFVDGGIIQVHNDNVDILAEIIEKAEDIKEDKIKIAKEKAMELLRNKPAEVDMADIERAVQREIHKSKFVKKWNKI
jgi:F-type H+-transporting ATPase subunit epsilon